MADDPKRIADDAQTEAGTDAPARDDGRRDAGGTGSIRPALTFGIVAATIQMAVILWLLYCRG